MGFLTGSSCLLQSPLSQSFSSSSSSSASPPLLRCSRRKVSKKRVLAMASMHGEGPENGSNSLQRRAFLLVGFSVFPFLQLRAVAVEGLLKDEKDLMKPEAQAPQKLDQEISPREQNQSEQQAPGNSFVSLLNELGIIGSGVLSALYATSQTEKTAMESTIESMKTKLTEKEAATTLLEQNFETRLQNEQEERQKQVKRLQEDEASLLNQLASANGTIAVYRQKQQSEEKLVEELKAQIDRLESGFAQAGEEKKMLEAKLIEKMDTVNVLQDRVSLLCLEIADKENNIGNLNLSIANKESECRNLSSIINQAKADLAEANSTVEKLKEEIFKSRQELNSKKFLVDDLDEKIKSLHAERDDTHRELHALKKEYNDLKSSSERKAAVHSELLSQKDHILHQFEEKLGFALSEASISQAMIADLTKERDDLRVMLEKEVNSMKNLKDELRITKEALGASRLETSSLSKQLEEAKRSCKELMSKISKMQDEFYEAKKSLISSMDEVKSTSKVLSDELVSVKEVLKRTEEELHFNSNELKAETEGRESLKKELLEIYKKAETTANELKEERKTVANLNGELKVLEKQMLKDLEARRALEMDLDEATKSLDEMNKSALVLSRELENTNSRTTSLEAEKELLFKSLIDQKNVTKEAYENVEDAQHLITRLGTERESLEKRAKKLEEELASAKGEILRLRRQLSLNRESINENYQTISEVGAGTPVSVKKTVSRRRKGGSTSEVS